MSEQDATDDQDASADAASNETPADASDEAAAGEEIDADDVAEELIERVESGDPEETAREIASLRTRVDGLEGRLDEKDDEIEELESKLKRKQADFQNYKKRMKKRREEERERATADLVSRMLDVRDNLVRALEQDEDTDIRGGVESTLRQFDDVLAAEDVETVDPEPGEDVDPERHQVLARVDSDQPEEAIADVHRPGYVMGDSVIREAQVTVSDGSGEE